MNIVIAMDTNATRLALAKHNAEIYGVANRIEFILADYTAFARTYSPSLTRKIDVVFLSPPWGGPAYLSGSPTKELSTLPLLAEEHPEYNLFSIMPVPGSELFHLSRRITRNIAYFLPRNTNLEEIAALLGEEDKEEKVEVEEEWMGDKLKALTCYFGGLAVGQEELF